ncbi:MAG: cytidylate kinase-like family protein [Anaerolineae bacterium]|nr:cytidylate kinase-like family protein [Anaerolineae bacterium]
MVSVTVSREYGSGGDEIARRVAQRLGIPLLDRELIEVACQLVEPEVVAACEARAGSQVPPSQVQVLPEETPSFAERLVQTITGGTRQWPRIKSLGPMPVGEEDSILRRLVPTDGAYVEVMRGVFHRILSQQGSAVFVGRGGQMLLADRPNVVHVHVAAPYAAQVRRVMQEEGLSESEAADLVHRRDGERSRYVSRYYGANWLDPSLYHLTVNTGRLTDDQAVELVLKTAEMVRVGELV